MAILSILGQSLGKDGGTVRIHRSKLSPIKSVPALTPGAGVLH
jgi:hypothetical protein